MAAKVQVLTIPPVNDWINGQLSAGQIQEVRIEDLLGRAVIQLDDAEVRARFSRTSRSGDRRCGIHRQ